MAMLVDFLRQLLETGEIAFQERPVESPSQHSAAAGFLREAYSYYRLEVAGPLLDFNAEVGIQAAEFVRRSCWFLVQRDEPDEAVDQRLTMSVPRLAADHLSADML